MSYVVRIILSLITFYCMVGWLIYEMCKDDIKGVINSVKEIDECSVKGHKWIQSEYGFGGNSPDSYIWICKRCGKWK